MNISTALGWLPILSILAFGVGPGAISRPATAHAWNLQAASVRAAQAVPSSQATESNLSELRLSAALIEEFLQVIYFTDAGRFHFREYSTCSYEFLQSPSVMVEDGLVRVAAEYYRRRGTEALGRCVGGPGASTTVSMSARPSAQGSTIAFEILEVKTESLPNLTAALLDLAGVELPMTHAVDLMGAMNRILHENQSFGVSSLEIHELLVEDGSVRLRLTLQLGIW